MLAKNMYEGNGKGLDDECGNEDMHVEWLLECRAEK